MSVTAVPLHPLGKGTIPKLWIGIFLLLLIGGGIAWLGTSGLRFTEASEGMRYRVLTTGTGEVLGKDDLARASAELRGPKGEMIGSTEKFINRETGEVGVLLPILLEESPSPIQVPNEVKAQLREGGVYQVRGPASGLLGPGLPPNIQASDEVELRLKVASIERGGLTQLRQQMMQQQMQQMQQLEQADPGAAPGRAPAGPPRVPVPPTLPGNR
jgi:FKBP-type peptidyl-prolyl cis-trans isomerase FkpA